MHRRLYILRHLFAALMLLHVATALPQQYTRGIGVYPGNPSEYFGPTMVRDNELRNLALHRAVYQSSSYDPCLTGQLLTDGEWSAKAPARLLLTANGKPVGKAQREMTLDGNEYTGTPVRGSEATLTHQWVGGQTVDADEVVVDFFAAYDENVTARDGYWTQCEVTDTQGRRHAAECHGPELPGTHFWSKVSNDPDKQVEGDGLPARTFKDTFRLRTDRPFHTLKLTMHHRSVVYWLIRDISFRKKGQPVANVQPSAHFSSAWMADAGDWAYVDLGAPAHVQTVCVRPAVASGKLEIDVSHDAKEWEFLANLDVSKAKAQGAVEVAAEKDNIKYVRVRAKDAVALSELEVIGSGGLKAVPHPELGWQGQKYMLSGGPWTLCPLNDSGKPSAAPIVATVPATVLSSYRNVGALPDPLYDDNLSMISESFFNRDFLYRRTFRIPAEMKRKHVVLHFDGINWKAEVKLNGERLGRIEGAFTRGEFDITEYLREENTLEVLIHRTAHPGGIKTKTSQTTSFNGGVLGADNPTFHATVGWDWITTTPGRDIGIWNDVYLTATEAVSLSDPLVETQLQDGRATLTPRVFLRNHSREAVAGVLEGFVGSIRFEKNVLIEGGTETEISFSPQTFSQLRNQELDLWWPVGYGRPHLHEAGFTFKPTNTAARQPVELRFKAGIREVTYRDENTRLQIFINGRRLIPLGGNWGFPESHLNYRDREYDIAVGYHAQMNCNMIRNWVGQTGDEEFYEACDRHGIMVWQDFWLANPVDGPNPDDERMFARNAADYVRRIRAHACLALFCGRNEGYPPATLNTQLRDITQRLIPGSLYIPSSADDGVSGHGPYQARPVVEYFEKQTGKLHTERGMPAMPTAESLHRMLAPQHQWPQDEYWGKHDFTQFGAQNGRSFNQLLQERFGNLSPAEGQDTLETYATLAQWQNFEGYRAMYEAAATQRQGLLIWMSHPCWPSMVWQTYDYYFCPTAAFFGVRKACEPLHAQYNPKTNMVELVNLSVDTCEVSVVATIYDLHGSPLWQRRVRVESPTDTSIDCFAAPAPEAYEGTYFLSLACESTATATTSPNVYVLSTRPSQKDLFQLANTRISVTPTANRGQYIITNLGKEPALMLRLDLKGSDGEQILPVSYSENYFHLMPGQRMSVSVLWNENDARGTSPVLHISGFNIAPQKLKMEN